MKRRLIGLDLFRIFLALVVFIFHSNIFAGCYYYSFNFLVWAGSPFMTGFFMLSGFSLFYSMQNRELSRLKDIIDFYIKRLIGIIPLYWVIVVVYHLAWGDMPLKEVLLLLPMDLLGLRSTLYFFPNNQFIWFVSNILLCYLVYPFLHQVIRQISIRGKYILTLILLSLDIYITAMSRVFGLADPLYYSISYRIVEFIIGMLLVSILDTVRGVCKSNSCLWGLAFLEFVVLLLGLKFIKDSVLYAAFLIIIFCVMLLTLAQCESRQLENSPVVRYLSACTYSLFLSQIWTLRFFEKTVPDSFGLMVEGNNLLRLAIIWAATLALTVFLHQLVEKPAKKFLLSQWNKLSN